ncbi:hypothetical protein HanHA300_Chr16g0621191 [Helianthus annuus]|nr:hypothetical protein HanHA300_Chr16g0621191 [Helianthus annuus]
MFDLDIPVFDCIVSSSGSFANLLLIFSVILVDLGVFVVLVFQDFGVCLFFSYAGTFFSFF